MKRNILRYIIRDIPQELRSATWCGLDQVAFFS